MDRVNCEAFHQIPGESQKKQKNMKHPSPRKNEEVKNVDNNYYK